MCKIIAGLKTEAHKETPTFHEYRSVYYIYFLKF